MGHRGISKTLAPSSGQGIKLLQVLWKQAENFLFTLCILDSSIVTSLYKDRAVVASCVVKVLENN